MQYPAPRAKPYTLPQPQPGPNATRAELKAYADKCPRPEYEALNPPDESAPANVWRAYAYAFTFYGPPITPREAELQHIARVLEAKREERRELLIIAAFLTCLMVATYIFRVEGERDLANKVIDCLVTGQSRDYCEESVRY